MAKEQHRRYVAGFAERVQTAGRYGFGFAELAKGAPTSAVALRAALRRIMKTGAIRSVSPRSDFYLIVPPEYRSLGAPPIGWWLDDWMRHLAMPYYVGLLTAAEWYGSAHFAVMETQVMVPASLPSLMVGRERLRFVYKGRAAATPVREQVVERGQVRVSTPEATLLDLAKHTNRTGGIGNLALISRDLAAKCRTPGLLAALAANNEVAPAQRLGYVLEQIGERKLANGIHAWLADRHVQPVDLAPGAGPGRYLAERWRVRVNAELEATA